MGNYRKYRIYERSIYWSEKKHKKNKIQAIGSLAVPWNEISRTKLQLPPEPLTRGLPLPDHRSLCPLSSTEFVEFPPPRTKFLGTPLTQLDPILSQMSLLHILMSQCCKMHLFYYTSSSYVIGVVHFSRFLHYNSRIVLLLHYSFICIKSMLLEWHNDSMTNGDRGGTVVKLLCYKSEGRWFDPSWCHWNFLLK